MQKSRNTNPVQKGLIERKFAETNGLKVLESRQAWRGLLIPMVGASVFMASTVVNIIRTHRTHGWPQGAFTPADKVLMGMPLLIIGMTLFYQAEEAELSEVKSNSAQAAEPLED